MLLSITHKTRYAFTDRVVHGLQRLRLKPKTSHGQEVLDWAMDVSGALHQVEYDDQHHNHVSLVSIPPGTPEVVITCKGTVQTSDKNGVIGLHGGHVPLWCFLRPTPLTRAGNKVRALVSGVDADRADPLAFLHALSARIADEVEYVPGSTHAKTTAEQALTAGKGVCQDHAHILISAGRLLDIPMRYVGGYLKLDGSDIQEAGHGWAEAHVNGLGWVGFDVSNRICPDDRYVRVASGCDYGDAAPVTGVAVGAGETALDVHLSVGEKPVGQMQQQQQSQGA